MLSKLKLTLRGPLPGAEGPWDLSALLTVADVNASQPERHLWLVRLLEWLRHAPLPQQQTPTPILRLRHLLNVLERNPEHEVQVRAVLRRFWTDVDTAALLADFGFAPRMDLIGELGQRLRLRLLPGTPDTRDLAELFYLLFPVASDADWLDAIDTPTLTRLIALLTPQDGTRIDWQAPFLDAIMFLAASVRALGFSPSIRARMSRDLLVDRPFRQLARVAEDVCDAAEAGNAELLFTSAQYLRALLDTCRRCADSVHEHLEDHGVSVGLVFELDQLDRRSRRIEDLLTCVLSTTPGTEITRLLAQLVRTADERRSLRALFARHYSMLARKVAERSAETGEHYITRDRSAYGRMLKAAAGGGAVLAGTTLMKFFVLALGLTAFWAGFWAGINYAGSFVLIHLAHWTVATKQPAMTAPAMAEKLRDVSNDDAVEGFVDEVAHLIRSQSAGILGNLSIVAPVVLVAQLASEAVFGKPLVGVEAGAHVLDSLTLLGGTPLYAAFTGVLLFASSIIAGWVENWFVWHRLDSAIAWNPRIVAALGRTRAQRWAEYWRHNISGFTSNISLGLMLGIVPVVAAFFGLPIDVRHVTLSTGQLAAAAGAMGADIVKLPAFWWCVAAIPVTGLLNLSVSFLLAFKVALRSRGIRLRDRSRIYRAIRQRLWRKPLSFIVPPRDAQPPRGQ
ncbi:site-specific recombinase [Rhizobacter sp. Root1221]|uniref:site-specific recombinase n=1 Tax=Rhizobacter sp. Root1221 TaxID=1736433 RepID=UPI000700D7CE|nr:site-specific recombinase [Rhizobacter sp. Root1221]KQV99799.1 recombinase [Rhizobacter sp. Root1221]